MRKTGINLQQNKFFTFFMIILIKKINLFLANLHKRIKIFVFPVKCKETIRTLQYE